MKKLLLLISFALSAQVIQKDISDDLRARFWRAALEKLRADNAYDLVSRELNDTCAKDKKVLFLNTQGEPDCKAPDVTTK